MRKIFFYTAALVLLGSCSKNAKEELSVAGEQVSKAKMKQQDGVQQINFTQQNLFPEGVVYDPFNNRFYVSSVTTGDIGIVTPGGSYSAFITDPALTATTGLEIDKAHKRLYVSNSAGAVGIYDINTGERFYWVDLAALLPGAPIFINDIALDPQGNAYATNSLSPVIYKITPDGEASIFFQNTAFALAPGQFGFNGIEYGNKGYLLVSFTNNSQVVKIPVGETSAYSIVSFSAALNRPDGLLLSNNGKELIVVNNAGGGNGMVQLFTSTDDWESGTLSSSFSTGSVFPTTATTDGKNVYVLYAYLNQRAAGRSQFTIQEVPTDTRGNF